MKMKNAIAPLLTLALCVSSAYAADAPKVIDVWPGKPPGYVTDKAETVVENKPGDKPVKKVTNVSHPTLTIYAAPRDKDTGAAVIICPGGGYSILAWDLEGEEVATWLNSIGVTGIILKYRVPRVPGDPKDKQPIGPLQDAQRAISLVRSNAKEWGIDPKRIGILGFSAGGHLTVSAALNFDHRAYEAADDVDKVSCRPDFAVPIYPAYLIKKDSSDLLPEIKIGPQTPPMFLAQAEDDSLVVNSVALYLGLKHAGIPAELHVYTTGGHGFGLRPSDKPCSTWPQRCAEWLGSQGFLKKAAD